MSIENNAKLEKMNTEEKLKFAEKLVFGTDGVEIDLSSGMHVIKVEANNKNPHAEFLMYKVNISKGKISAAIEWLKKSYKQGYGMALAMMFYEFHRNNTRGISEDEVYKALKKAVELDVPVAHYLLGVVYEDGMFTYNKDKKKAKMHFERAQDLGFTEDFFAEYEYEHEDEKMTLVDFRGIFQREYLPDLFFENFDIFIEWFNEDKEVELINNMWYHMVESYGLNPENYSIDIKTDYFKDDRTAYFVMQLPESDYKDRRNTAVYIAVAMDMKGKKKPRYFLGELDMDLISNRSNRLVFVAEFKPQYHRKEIIGMEHINYGTLQDDPFELSKIENEFDVFIDRVIEICNK